MTNDCESGLACKPLASGPGGICVVVTFNVAETAKECVLSQCIVPADCCPTPPSNCPELLKEACVDGGAPDICHQVQSECTCDVGALDCLAEHCVLRCQTDPECVDASSGKLTSCAAGYCVQCLVDDDCGSDLFCVNGACQSPCQSDGDCPGFQRCVDTKCVAGGCRIDRECISATQNVEATCGTDGRCITPCQTDLECGGPTAYTFYSCIDHQCTYTGCQSDKDCRFFFTGPSDASTLGPHEHVTCRDKPAPGAMTQPAH